MLKSLSLKGSVKELRRTKQKEESRRDGGIEIKNMLMWEGSNSKIGESPGTK